MCKVTKKVLSIHLYLARGLQLYLKRDLGTGVFPCFFAKFLKTPSENYFCIQLNMFLIFLQDVKLARVDCETQQKIALDNMISKYPTMKLFRNGKPLRKEYRGQRSVDAFSNFIKEHLKPSVTDITTSSDDVKIDVSFLLIGDKKNFVNTRYRRH